MSDEAAVWRALADPTRRRVLDLLRDGPRTTGALAAAFPDVTRFAVMKHLATLQDAGLVVVERSGRERWNHLNAVPLRAAYERWMAPYAERAAESLLRLKDHAEQGGQMEINLRHELVVDRPREQVFDALCEMGEWFPHRVVPGTAAVLEPHVGGRFYERHDDSDGVLYCVVSRLQRPSHLTLSGAMGMRGAVVGVISYELVDEGGSTRVRHSHQAFGDIDEETTARYTAGWTEVHAALQDYALAR